MTRAEFDVWVEQHYDDLLYVAISLVGGRDARDALQDALARIVDKQTYRKCQKNPLAYFTTVVRSAAFNTRRGRGRAVVAKAEVTYLRTQEGAGVLFGVRKKPHPSLAQMDGIEGS